MGEMKCENEIELLKIVANILATEKIKESPTLRLFCKEYLEYIEQNRSSEYLKSITTTLNKLKEHFGNYLPLNRITVREAERFILDIKKEAPSGYRVYYRNLKAAFNKAIEWEYIDMNPFSKIKLMKRQINKPIFLTKEELQPIVKNITNKDVKDAVWLSFYAGLRIGEILNLKWKHVDLINKIITVGDEEYTTKGKKQRFVPINNELHRILTNRKKQYLEKSMNIRVPKIFPIKNANICTEEGLVLCKANGYGYSRDYISKKFKESCKEVGADDKIHFHTLRHSFASNLAKEGISINKIKELLGHSSITTTMIYAHVRFEDLRDAVERL